MLHLATRIIIMTIKICYYNIMFTLEQENFIGQCYFRNGERLDNGEWSYSTPRVFEECQQKFPDFQGTYQQLTQKVYKCVNMFFEIGSVLQKKKGMDDRQKEQLKILKRLNKELQRPQINPSGDKPKKLTYHLVQFSLSLKKICTFFPIVCLLCILDNKSPHKITSLNIDRWIDL
jgi:hypothetical protein